MRTTDAPLSSSYAPQSPACTCWGLYDRTPSPMRCEQCVSALVYAECVLGDHGDRLAELAIAAREVVADEGLTENGHLLASLVLDALVRALRDEPPVLLVTVATRRGQYAAQLRPASHLRGPRPPLRLVPAPRG